MLESILIIVFSFVTSVTDAETNNSFSVQWVSAENIFPQSVNWGDYDNDGDLDLAVGGSKVLLYQNENGVMREQFNWSWPSPSGNFRVNWSDFDRDMDLDLTVVVNGFNDNDKGVVLLRNRNGLLEHQGTWSAAFSIEVISAAWGDYNGDAYLDLAIALGNGSTLIYRNENGTLALNPAQTLVSEGRGSASWADFDSDGDVDLAVGRNIYINHDQALSPIPIQLSIEGDNAIDVVFGDYDGDNDLDIAATGSNTVLLFTTEDASIISDPVWESTNSFPANSLAWGDYDGDGDLDLVAGGGSENSPSIYLFQNENGQLMSSGTVLLEGVGGTSSLAWGDYDNDGDLDIAAGLAGSQTVLLANSSGGLTRDSIWTPNDVYHTNIAWGDYDGDRDLDIAVSESGFSNRFAHLLTRIYNNESGQLGSMPIWDTDGDIDSLAWADFDADGDLDLVLAPGLSRLEVPRLRFYRNDNGQFINISSSSQIEPNFTTGIAWGDYDGDGDLDLAANHSLGQLIAIYKNHSGSFSLSDRLSAGILTTRGSIAWGDYDNDGDLDLVADGLYRNDDGKLIINDDWRPTDMDHVASLAWGDVDSDGDLDLAVGSTLAPVRIYHNIGSMLSNSFTWYGMEPGDNTSVAWGDYDGDGDLDLVAGGRIARIYRNEGGVLNKNAVWSSTGTGRKVAWGDFDNDGDLDLAAGVGLYQNGLSGGARLPNNPPLVTISRPLTPDAAFYSVANIIDSPIIQIPFSLVDPDGDAIGLIRAYYSIDGGGHWLPANTTISTTNATTNTLLEEEIATICNDSKCVYPWNAFSSSFFGKSDNVVFRMVVIPGVRPATNGVAGPYQRPYVSATTFPFRVRGTQVRVCGETAQPCQQVTGAEVYRTPAAQPRGGERFPPRPEGLAPLATDGQGYLQGRGQINIGDQLVALQPISATDTYTLYFTSVPVTTQGLLAHKVTEPGVQTLTVSPENPLILFNLDVSLEWDARSDPQFLAQLERDLRRASEVLYDWSDGQAALGHITVYQNRERWDDAHIRVYATNRLRPNAVQGGIVAEEIADPASLASGGAPVTYGPGQLRMGAVWNRYGDPGGSLGEDWPRTLAHELGHYALFLDDGYLGLEDGVVVPVSSCRGAMSDPYRDDYSELQLGGAEWRAGCARTMAAQSTGRSDWETIKAFYDHLDLGFALNAPPAFGANSGPALLPLEVTQVTFAPLISPTEALEVPIFLLARGEDKASYLSDGGARAYLFPKEQDRIVDLGSPTLGRVLARGARPGDRLCVYDLPAGRLGCVGSIVPGEPQLLMKPVAGWRPEVTVTPVTSTSLSVGVSNLTEGLTLTARLFPSNVISSTPATTVRLTPTGDGAYAASLTLAEPAFEGYVHVWVEEADDRPRREVVVDYTLGGNPGRAWLHRAPRGSPGRAWLHRAPVISVDGQVILYSHGLSFAEGQFFVIQAAGTLPSAPSWATRVGQAYRIAANAPLPAGTAISFNYLGDAVPAGEEQGLSIYVWDERAEVWSRLPTSLSPDHNLASARIPGPGLYALMSSVQLPLRGPGWSMFAFPVPGSRPMPEALQSIAGSYTTVYGYDQADQADPWKLYDAGVPPAWSGLVNDLEALEYGRGYWINLTATGEITGLLRGTTPPTIAAGALAAPAQGGSLPSPPATYYGKAPSPPSFTPAAGMVVTARIGEQVCGRAETREWTLEGSTQIVYTVSVLADGGGPAAGCGVYRRPVSLHFTAGGKEVAILRTVWDNTRVLELQALPVQGTYLPAVRR